MRTLWTLALCACVWGGSAQAQQSADAVVSLELNKLEANDAVCQAYMVTTNGSEDAIDSLRLDLVIFDADDVIARRIAVEMGPLRAGKTVVKAFEIADVDCAAIGRLLLNDVLSCGDADDDCLDLVTTSSRTAAPFIQ